jgi:hypothetical protein
MLEITETTTVVIEPLGPGGDRDLGPAGEVTVVVTEKTRRVVLDRETANFAVAGITVEPMPISFQEESCE